tara:strand:- start:63 stop:335 length:273 start_codon:yes stop_codon:yes gene_type:complete
MERKTRSAFKLRSGNKPSISKMAGVSPMKKDITASGLGDLKTRTVGDNKKYFDGDKEIDLQTFVRTRKERIKKAKELNPDFKPKPFEDLT